MSKRLKVHIRAAELSAIDNIKDASQRRRADSMFQRTYIDEDLLREEPRVQTSLWPEYGYMTPLERTRRFTHEYIAAYKRQWAVFDPQGARKKKPAEGNFGRNSVAVMNSLWKARQKADELGMPYDVFLDALVARRLGKKGNLHLPRPNQLLSDKAFKARLRGLPTRDQVAERLLKPHWDARFFKPREENDAVQATALEQLRVDVLRADSPKDRLAKYFRVRGLLSKQLADDLFFRQPELVDEAWALADARVPFPEPQGHLTPACFGNRNTKLHACQLCMWSDECKRFKVQVAHALRRKTGSSDPRREHRRKVDRDRQRRYRDRKSRELSRSP
jgi:hypothetical protein